MARKIKVFGEPKYLKFLRAPRFKYGYTIMSVLPWDKDYGMGAEGASAAQLEVWARFAEVAHDAKGPLHQRMEEIGRRLSVGKGGVASEVYGIPTQVYLSEMAERRRKPEEVIRKEIENWRALARAKVHQGPVASMGRRLEVAGL